MKEIAGILIVIGILFLGCETKEDTQNNEVKEAKKEYRPLTSYEKGIFTEWYPGHKQIKVRGRQTEDGKKQGVWRSYNSEGYEMSIIVYKDGKKHGHVVVYHPNGAVYYSGEYKQDERVGEWKFYNEKGALVKEENYDSTSEK